jgi:integrase
MSSVFKKARDRKRPGSSWYIAYSDENGIRRMVKGCPDKAATKAMARKLESEAELRRRGVIDPKADAYRDYERRPLSEHLADWCAFLVGKGDTPAHADMSRRRVARLVALVRGARLETIAPAPAGTTRQVRALAYQTVSQHLDAARLADLIPSRVQAVLATLRDEGFGAETINHYVRAVKAFSRWLWRDGRAREHVLVHLSTNSPESDRRRVRRALTSEEAGRLVEAAERGPVVKGMSGPDRAMVYRLALGTGFRREELRGLFPRSFRLDSNPPTIVCEAAYTKNGQRAEQPVSEALAAALRPYLATKPPGRPVFATLPTTRTAAMLRHDLAAAGIAYETPSGVCDFHSLRGVYISNLVASGASVKTCQVLARHSTPSLTIGVYAKASIHDLTGAVESLPDLTPTAPQPEALTATGTDPVTPSCHILAAHGQRAGDGTGRDAADAGGCDGASIRESVCRNSLEQTGVDASGRTLAGVGRAGIEPATPGFSVLCSTS